RDAGEEVLHRAGRVREDTQVQTLRQVHAARAADPRAVIAAAEAVTAPEVVLGLPDRGAAGVAGARGRDRVNVRSPVALTGPVPRRDPDAPKRDDHCVRDRAEVDSVLRV